MVTNIVYILFFSQDGTIYNMSSLPDPNESTIPVSTYLQFGCGWGHSIALLLDITGDLIPDMIVSDPIANNFTGVVYVLAMTKYGYYTGMVPIVPFSGNFFQRLPSNSEFGMALATQSVGAVQEIKSFAAVYIGGIDILVLNNNEPTQGTTHPEQTKNTPTVPNGDYLLSVFPRSQ